MREGYRMEHGKVVGSVEAIAFDPAAAGRRIYAAAQKGPEPDADTREDAQARASRLWAANFAALTRLSRRPYRPKPKRQYGEYHHDREMARHQRQRAKLSPIK